MGGGAGPSPQDLWISAVTLGMPMVLGNPGISQRAINPVAYLQESTARPKPVLDLSDRALSLCSFKHPRALPLRLINGEKLFCRYTVINYG